VPDEQQGPEQGTRPRVAVVGAGISGLAAALYLHRAGYAVELVERDEALGGRLGVGRLGERDIMMGGKNIGRKYTAFRGFTGALGDHPYEPFGINASRVKDGQVLTIDSTRRTRSLRHLRQMGRSRDLLKLARLAYRIRKDPDNRFLGAPYFAELARRSDATPLSSHFGAELADTLLRPMTVRMNGAEPDEVYLGTFNTNLALLMDTYDQLANGIQPVLAALAERVDVRLNARAESLVVERGRVVGLRIAENGQEAVEHRYDGVVVAAPAFAAADIVRAELPGLGKRLEEVRYFPTTVAIVEYAAPVFNPDVRALALDDGPCSNAGSYGMEDRHIVRYTFSGRHGRVSELTPERLEAWIAETERRLVAYLGIRMPARVRQVDRHWDAGYCAYVPFVGDFLTAVREAAAGLPGLELAGDYLRGVNLEACARSGADAGTRMDGYLRGTAR
jgi:protoporphyrinogen/coproporphyrinogen III oxidase